MSTPAISQPSSISAQQALHAIYSFSLDAYIKAAAGALAAYALGIINPVAGAVFGAASMLGTSLTNGLFDRTSLKGKVNIQIVTSFLLSGVIGAVALNILGFSLTVIGLLQLSLAVFSVSVIAACASEVDRTLLGN